MNNGAPYCREDYTYVNKDYSDVYKGYFLICTPGNRITRLMHAWATSNFQVKHKKSNYFDTYIEERERKRVTLICEQNNQITLIHICGQRISK